MKKILVILSALFILTACSSTAEYRKISAAEAKDIIETQAPIIVDVRTAEEFASGHIANAINIPVESITTAPVELPDKEALILIYCRSGNRSEEATRKLLDLGYTNLYDFGGIIDWPYEVVQ
jgi:rhodanese-related sulfurtransferase